MNNFIADTILYKIRSEMRSANDLIDRLRKQGYTESFQLVNSLLMCTKNHQYYEVGDLQVDEVYRFDDPSGILDRLFIYAIHEPGDDLNGIFVLL